MKQLNLLLFFLFLSTIAFAQGSLKGIITDAETGESLIGANIVVGTNGVTSDFDGNYVLKLAKGTHEVKFSYIGFEDITKTVTIDNQDVTLDIKMGGALELTEITVTADIATARKTPVAFKNISTAKLNEELASQDIPMILNSTPGAYATAQGGGDGDARVTIRGFDQRNIAVMLDGIPVNDMENGWVYWSNWFGLDLVTKTMQVQRGLGASKLAIPSVGGTINILTKGINANKEVRFKQEVGNNGYLRSTLGLTTGRLKNGWGISAAASYKQGNGWVDATSTEGYFYYLRIDKEIGNHLFSLSGFGAPQEHGQRSYTSPVATFDTTYAKELGVESENIADERVDMGLRYNQHAGILNGEIVNTKKNYYHKPQFSLRHSWDNKNRFFWSNIVYLSVGNGGGTTPRGSDLGSSNLGENGMFDLDQAYLKNTTTTFSKPEGLSDNYLRSSVNNHFWYGLLSTAEFKMNDNWSFSGGIDLRDYTGEHKREAYDLLGGDYINNYLGIQGTHKNLRNYRLDESATLEVGDAIEYNHKGYVRWGGIFGMAEYDKEKLSAFVNVSTALSAYAYEDFLKYKVINLADTTLRVSSLDNITYGDKTYTIDSPEAENFKIDWVYRPSFTIKTGAAYRLDQQNSFFFNVGYLSRPTRYNNVIRTNQTQAPGPNQDGTFAYNDAELIGDPRNEIVTSAEVGYSYKSKQFSGNINAYYTVWNNKPLETPAYVLDDPNDPDSDRIPVNVQGLAARHTGIEFDFAYAINDQLTVEGLASIGDWIWASADTVELPDGGVYEFDPIGVHVGDAAQIQLGGLIRYEPIKGLYFKLKTTYFAKNFANFNPESLKGATARTESWQIPNYNLMDFHAGYNFKIKGVRTGIRFNLLNILNTKYISDARNNDTFNSPAFSDFDAKSASVFLGQGIRWNTSLQFTF